MNTAAEKVIGYLKDDKRTSAELAKECKVSREYIRLLRSGKRNSLGVSALERILNGLGKPFSDLDSN